MSGVYTARATREEGWWTVTVDEVPGLFTQTRRLDQIEDMVRDALALFPEIEADPENAAISTAVEADITAPAETARQLRAAAEQAQIEATKAMTATAKLLSSRGLPYRDIGHLLGVSFQQAQKLATA
ncbi:transcriptional regulator [Corynebacterium hylobatis]|uniref:Transcriptional regulator n=1 Tax=Corynebacterium hylobatis TaxID=1859290 RepID=A0A3S0C2T9_9CORY|nr:transcriptional regulator [Corynebacterium hylobatis]RSZ65522.1 transcriptional regulator [Corynebacterium hylobatis]